MLFQFSQACKDLLLRRFIQSQVFQLIFIQNLARAIGGNPQIERKINISHMPIFDDGGLGEVAVPAFLLSIVPVIDLEDVVPLIGIKRFDKTVVAFQNDFLEGHVLAVEEGFDCN